MTDDFLERLAGLVPADQFSIQKDVLAVAARDESTTAPVTPRAVVWALSLEEISEIVKLCCEHGVPITTRGGGSALEGSTVPLQSGIVLDLIRLRPVTGITRARMVTPIITSVHKTYIKIAFSGIESLFVVRHIERLVIDEVIVVDKVTRSCNFYTWSCAVRDGILTDRAGVDMH